MPANSVMAKQLSVFVQGLTYHPATHHMKVALWVAQHHCPFAIIKDPELLNIFRDLNNKCTTPSASTVSRDIKEIFQLTHKNVAQMLQVRSLFPFSYLVLMTVRLTKANYISALTAGHHLKQYHSWDYHSLDRRWQCHFHHFTFCKVRILYFKVFIHY